MNATSAARNFVDNPCGTARTDARLVAATNVSLEMVEQKRFRADSTLQFRMKKLGIERRPSEYDLVRDHSTLVSDSSAV